VNDQRWGWAWELAYDLALPLYLLAVAVLAARSGCV
jgi:hypothetical protein